MLFTFPSRYLFTIGLSGVFSLAGWARLIHTGLHVSRATQDPRLGTPSSRKGLSPATAALSNAVPVNFAPIALVLLPLKCRNIAGLGSSAFARHYLRNHCYFLFLRVLRCFSSPRSPPHLAGIQPSTGWVPPFGHHRVKGCLRLTGAFRSLPRPSSPH